MIIMETYPLNEHNTEIEIYLSINLFIYFSFSID